MREISVSLQRKIIKSISNIINIDNYNRILTKKSCQKELNFEITIEIKGYLFQYLGITIT